MNKNMSLIIIIIFFYYLFINLNADSRIILYIKTPPTNIVKNAIKASKKDLHIDKKMAPGQKIIRVKAGEFFTPKLSGFLSVYAGFMDISDKDGLISFPLRHSKPKIYLAITKDIKIVKVKENTISHKEFLPDLQVKLYSFEKKDSIDPKDPTKKTLYWSVNEIQGKNEKKVNPLTIVILTDPSNIYVPTGDFLSMESPHLILP